jgi:predicted exporter
MIKNFLFNNRRFCFYIWFGLFLFALFGLWLKIQSQSSIIQTDILKLLPQTSRDKVVEKAISQFTDNFSSSIFFLIGASEKQEAIQYARKFYQTIMTSGLVEEDYFYLNKASQSAFTSFYFPYRYHLLSKENRQLLLTKNGKKIQQKAWLILQNPFIPISGEILHADPFLLFVDFVNNFPYRQGKLVYDEGYLIAHEDGYDYVFMSFKLKSSIFSIQSQQELMTVATSAMVDLPKKIRLLYSGLAFYSAASKKQAEQEITLISSVSFIAVVALIILFFRSILPVFYSLFSITAGFLTAMLACVYWFGEVHILTLVFGSTLIGISDDYNFHYFSEQEKPSFNYVFNGITIAMLVNAVSFLVLLITPFHGIQQIAVFTSAGLIGAYLTIVLCFPYCLDNKNFTIKHSLLKLSQGYLALWRQLDLKNWQIASALIILSSGILFLKPNDDIRLLKATPDYLEKQEQAIKNIIQPFDANQFFIIEGKTLEAVLRTEESLYDALDDLIARKKLTAYQALSQYAPSQQKQRQNYELLQTELFSPLLVEQGQLLGFSDSIIHEQLKTFQENQSHYLTLQTWFKSEIGKKLSYLWLGKIADNYASIIALNGIQADSIALLKRVAENNPHVRFINQVENISELFRLYRRQSSVLLLIILLVCFIGLGLYYNVRKAFNILLSPLTAILLTISIIAYFQIAFNLFNVFALILILGIGIDDTIFLSEAREDLAPAMASVMLSSFTTLLAFGLLSLSQTPAMKAFGLTLTIGIASVLLLSPLSVRSHGDC